MPIICHGFLVLGRRKMLVFDGYKLSNCFRNVSVVSFLASRSVALPALRPMPAFGAEFTTKHRRRVRTRATRASSSDVTLPRAAHLVGQPLLVQRTHPHAFGQTGAGGPRARLASRAQAAADPPQVRTAAAASVLAHDNRPTARFAPQARHHQRRLLQAGHRPWTLREHRYEGYPWRRDAVPGVDLQATSCSVQYPRWPEHI